MDYAVSFQYMPLGQDVPHTGKFNQRASVRYQCAPATSGRVYLDPDKEFLPAWVLDLSIQGVGLVVHRALEPGLYLVVQVKSNTTKKAYQLGVHVVHSTPHSSGEWIVGCEFVEKLSGEQLDDLL